MKSAALLILVFTLAGCAHVRSTTPRSVVVQSMSGSNAQDKAQAECQKSGRHARLASHAPGNSWFFDCVE